MHHLQLQLQAKAVDLEQMTEAREKAEEELMEKENILQKELREHEEEKKRLEAKHQQEVNHNCHDISRLNDHLETSLIYLLFFFVFFSLLSDARLEFALGGGALCAALQPGRGAEETDHPN